jgi:hypothetical protein
LSLKYIFILNNINNNLFLFILMQKMKSNIKSLFILILIIYQAQSYDYLKVTPTPVQMNQSTWTQAELPKVASLTNGNVVIVWQMIVVSGDILNIYFNVWDPNGNKLIKNDVLVGTTPQTTQQVYPFVCSDGNGGFVIVWEYRYTSGTGLLRHYDATFTPGNIITLFTNGQSSIYTTHGITITRVSNGNYITFYTNNAGGVYSAAARLLDSNFNPIGTEFFSQSNTSNSELAMSVLGLTKGGFVLLRESMRATRDVYFIIYDNNGNAKTGDILINSDRTTGVQSSPQGGNLNNGNFVVVWTDDINSGDMIFRIFDVNGNAIGNTITANTITAAQQHWDIIFTLSGGFAIMWRSYYNNPTPNLIFQVFDNDGNKIGSERTVNTNTTLDIYGLNGIELMNGNILITWTQGGSTKTVLAEVYYKNDGVCQNLQFQISGGQLTINFSGIKYSSIVLKTLPTNGQLKDDNQVALVINTFIDKTKIYYVQTNSNGDSFTYATNMVDGICRVDIMVCFISCLTCSKAGDIINNNCIQCAANYAMIKDSTTNNCYSKTVGLQGYYFDSNLNLFNKCYTRCATCTNGGDDSKNNCSTCLPNYYTILETPNQCYASDEKIPGYFFDVLNAKFTKCYQTCGTCSNLGDDTNHTCTTCKLGFTNTEYNKYNCYSVNSTVLGYYYDLNSNLFKKCYISCSKCTGAGDIFTPNCTECASDYTVCTGCSTMIYRSTCVDECPILTVYDATAKTCTDCKSGEVVFENQCVSSCPLGYIKDNTTCFSCFGKNLINYNNTCVDKCPSNLVFNATTNACEIKCDDGVYDKTKNACVSCSSINKLSLQGNCVDICPEGYIASNSYCQQTISTVSPSTDACKSSPCLNEGTCSNYLGNYKCSCTSQYLGSTCQYAAQNFNFANLVGKIYINF